MPSITYWNRLEPRSRTDDFSDALAARIRDPLWMLARQWQMGEFQGEDAGSPAWVNVAATVSETSVVRFGDQPDQPLKGPLENAVESEAFFPGLTIRVELGQIFEDFLARSGAAALASEFLRVFPLTAADADDRDAARFALAVAGRAIDGYEVYTRASLPLKGVKVTPAQEPAVRQALTDLIHWVRATYGELGASEATAWRADCLEYRAELKAALPQGSAILSATSAADGNFEWFQFQGETKAVAATGMRAPQTTARSVIPAQVRFPGMPNARWWDFENGTVSFGNLLVDREDTARLIFMDFLLIHGNDWFLIPFEQPVGSLCRIDSLTVRDVFGETHTVERAGSREWTMWSLSSSGAASAADLFFLAPSAGPGAISSEPMEDVGFFRDEMANLVWAIEDATEGALGQSRRDPVPPASPAPPAASAPGVLRYRLATQIPANWIPLIPVALDPKRGQIALEIASGAAEPHAKILQPPAGRGPYRIREEQIPREGVHVTRRLFRCRWWDGETQTWIGRGTRTAASSSTSGLRFDVAD